MLLKCSLRSVSARRLTQAEAAEPFSGRNGSGKSVARPAPGPFKQVQGLVLVQGCKMVAKPDAESSRASFIKQRHSIGTFVHWLAAGQERLATL